MDLEYLKNHLKPYVNNLVYLREIGSTNDYAKENRVPDDTLIITSNQLSGRGRFDRQWESDKDKDITMSLVKSFKISPDDLFIITFYASLLILKTLKKFTGAGNNIFSLKWPNDVLLNGKKICGILTDIVENKAENKKLVIGIGVNVNKRFFGKKLHSKATSLANEFSEIFNLSELISEIIKDFYLNLLLIENKAKIISLWKSETDILGKTATIKVFENSEELKCKLIDIENDGGIKVEIENEIYNKYFCGDISILESY